MSKTLPHKSKCIVRCLVKDCFHNKKGRSCNLKKVVIMFDDNGNIECSSADMPLGWWKQFNDE